MQSKIGTTELSGTCPQDQATILSFAVRDTGVRCASPPGANAPLGKINQAIAEKAHTNIAVSP